MAISNTELTNRGGDIIFECPGTIPSDVQEHTVTCLIFCNTNGSQDISLSLDATPYGGSNGMIINGLTISSTETFTFDTEKLVLSTGDLLTAITDYDGLVATVSSFRVS